MTAAAVHRRRSRCGACDGARLVRFLELGEQPLANSFLDSAAAFAAEPRFPLNVQYCEDCFLVQLQDLIDPEVMFRHYLYVTGTSDTIAAHNVAYAAAVVQALQLGEQHRVVELASNDGSLLRCFQRHGVAVLGVDPARNLAERARAAGVPTEAVFFGAAEAERLRREFGPAQAVIGNNVLAHVAEPRDFLRGARRLLAPGGRVIVEVPYLGPFLERVEYDTIYHEHVYYYSLGALAALCAAAGLVVERADLVPVHGGSVRVWAAPAEEVGAVPAGVQRQLQQEDADGWRSARRYRQFAEAVARQRRLLRELLDDLQRAGRTVAAYGASAKGNTLLNYCGVTPAQVAYVADKNPLKVGRFTPGTHLPVVPAATLVERQPDYVLILAWNFAEEIMQQQRTYRDRGGRFILPVPEPRIV